jgi:hypothetical protein
MSTPLPKYRRLEELVRRLLALAPMADHDTARRAINETLNAVEDELSGVPFDPNNWRTDGRMYPVQDDNAFDVDGHPDVTSYLSVAHETLVRANGAFEIRGRTTKVVVLAKPGSDGKGVWT